MATGVGSRVAVDARTVADDSVEFAGLVGTVEETYDDGTILAVRFDSDPEAGLFEFAIDELCPAVGFMPGATDMKILTVLLGKRVRFRRDLEELGPDDDYVKPTNARSRWYRVERRSPATFDQLHFVGEYGFRTIYLSNIVDVAGE